jgi:hypothetical protein
MSYRHFTARVLPALVATVSLTTSTVSAYVTPKMGGGQTMAPMKHADIYFDGVNITIVLDTTVATPILRPLTPPDQFDPAQPWSILGYRAYNYQYAWNPGAPFTLPAGGAIWVERLSQDPALEVFLRPPQWVYSEEHPKWTSIFLTDGERWKWGNSMQHNAYTVCGTWQTTYTATYKVYIGDVDFGVPLDGYGSDTVTFTWNAHLVGDMNDDGLVDGADVAPFTLALVDPTAYETAFPTCRWYDADCTCDGIVDETDVQALVNKLLGS